MNAVEAEDLAVALGGYPVLHGVQFALPLGSYTAVIGPNGAGKSTLLKAMLGLVPPGSGRLTVFDQPVHSVPGHWLGYIPQAKTLDRSFPARALDLVATGLRGAWPWRLGQAERVQCLDVLERVGAAHVAGRALAHLSGGELQRVYLARALVRTPRLILLDEPAAGMDAAGEADMYHILERYQQDAETTVVMVTHDWEGAGIHASHVLLLNRTVLDFGPPAGVLKNARLLAAFGHTGHAELRPEDQRP